MVRGIHYFSAEVKPKLMSSQGAALTNRLNRAGVLHAYPLSAHWGFVETSFSLPGNYAENKIRPVSINPLFSDYPRGYVETSFSELGGM